MSSPGAGRPPSSTTPRLRPRRPGPGHDRAGWVLLVLLGVLTVALLGPTPAAAAPVTSTAITSTGAVGGAVGRTVAPRPEWRWPTAGEPAVLRRFVAPAQRWSPGHRGVDLEATAGDVVLAPVAGVVAFAGTVVDRPVLSLVADDGTRTTLEPVTASVPVGREVAAGDVVGVLAVGVGHCGGVNCLHWGVRRGRDAYVDPLLLVGRGLGPPVLLPLTGSAGTLRGLGTR